MVLKGGREVVLRCVGVTVQHLEMGGDSGWAGWRRSMGKGALRASSGWVKRCPAWSPRLCIGAGQRAEGPQRVNSHKGAQSKQENRTRAKA